MVCAQCHKPIAPGAVHWRGRHGGEWHPACYARATFGRGWAVGMWRGEGAPGMCDGNPPEYDAEVDRLRAGKEASV